MSDAFDIGILSLEYPGKQLALRLEECGYSVLVCDQDRERATAFILQEGGGRRIAQAGSLREFVDRLATPRKILLLVPPGPMVDESINALAALVERSDVVADCGDSYFEDTARRVGKLASPGARFLGIGISGPHDAQGLAIMIGGHQTGFELFRPVLERLTTDVEGRIRVAWLGGAGAGHMVKMCHDAVALAQIQSLTELAHLMENRGYPTKQIVESFAEFKTQELHSNIVSVAQLSVSEEPPQRPQGSGLAFNPLTVTTVARWAIQAAVDVSVPVPSLAAAVDSRLLNTPSPMRTQCLKLFPPPPPLPPVRTAQDGGWTISSMVQAFQAATFLQLAQTFQLASAISQRHDYGTRLESVAQVWQGGQAIPAKLLTLAEEIFSDQANRHLLANEKAIRFLVPLVPHLRQIVAAGTAAQIPMPVLSASLAYFEQISLPPRDAVIPGIACTPPPDCQPAVVDEDQLTKGWYS